MNKPLKKVAVYLDEDHLRKLKSELALKGKTLSGWVREVIEKELKKK